MLNNDHPIESIPAFVLGALDADEAARVAAHLAACPSCRAEAESFRTVVGMLPYAAGAAEPPARVKRQLFARIAATSAESAVPAAPERPVTPPSHSAKPVRWAVPVMALSLALALGFGAATFEARAQADRLAMELATSRQTLGLVETQLAESRQSGAEVAARLMASQQQLAHTQAQLAESQREVLALQEAGQQGEQFVSFIAAPQTVSRTLGTTGQAPDKASARVFMQPGHNRLVVLIHGLHTAEPGKVYRLWLARDNQAVAIGTITVDEDGIAELAVDAPEPMDTYDQVMITLDAMDMTTRPSDEVIFEANL
ncbi:MAG: anti-sigma factor [Chloroflexi bacterium]|nr:anti-sigma factor [Chloroflexota bacterium]